jgi:hypothetical protein
MVGDAHIRMQEAVMAIPSGQRRIRFTGLLQGEGQEAECSGWVIETMSRGELPPTYGDYRIDTVSKPLPDGSYTLLTHGSRLLLRAAEDGWEAIAVIHSSTWRRFHSRLAAQ